MNQDIIDTFYVIDFDRCLGSVDVSFRILGEILDKLKIINFQELEAVKLDYQEKGESFSVLDYIKASRSDVDFKVIENEYMDHVKANPEMLLEPGASDLIDFFNRTNALFCIMSYGDIHWQTLKIRAAGLLSIPTLVVDTKQKGSIINGWLDSQTKLFNVPSSLFKDEVSKLAREVVLIDDKATSFNSLPNGARGYWVNDPNRTLPFQLGAVPETVRAVRRIDEIIALESSQS